MELEILLLNGLHESHLFNREQYCKVGCATSSVRLTLCVHIPRNAWTPRTLRGFCPINPRGFHACSLPPGPRGVAHADKKHEVT